MEQTNTPPSDVPVESPKPQVDPTQLKSLLNLPETASDLELITVMTELIANLQQQYDALLADATAMRDSVANRDLQEYADVISNEAQPFWRDLLLINREKTVETLQDLRLKQQSAPAAVPTAETLPEPSKPLRNRLADMPRTIVDLTNAITPDMKRAAAIRNRAHELRANQKISWPEAFARAEKENK